jgi:RNA polymerase sigma factor (sigma-70 family)
LRSEDVLDLYQEVCLALWRAGPARIVNTTWLFHTAGHCAADILKRQRGRLELPVAAVDRTFTLQTDPELTLLVRAELRRLPKSLRRFYHLRYEKGYTQSELAQNEHMTRGSIRGMERKCLRLLAGRRARFF